jgi:hypothetical protein|tara:strand:- start:1049 stop:1672 length:624 start_codon:yes stop_codon:yes gene_type:complete
MNLQKKFQNALKTKIGNFFLNGPLIRLPEEMLISKNALVLGIGNDDGQLLEILNNRIDFKHKPDIINFEKKYYIKNNHKIDIKYKDNFFKYETKNTYDLILCGYYVSELSNNELEDFLINTYKIINPEGLMIIWDFSKSTKYKNIQKVLLFPFTKNKPLQQTSKKIIEIANRNNIGLATEITIRPFLFPFTKRWSVLLGKPPSDRIN